MADLEPDDVQVFAAQLHRVYCLPGAMPTARYSRQHLAVHERHAKHLLAGLANAGYNLTTTKET